MFNEYHCELLKHRLSIAASLPRSRIGAHAILYQANLDASACDQPEWAHLFRVTLAAGSPKADRQALLSIRDAHAGKVWSNPLSPPETHRSKSIRQIRLKILIEALIQERSIPSSIVNQVKKICSFVDDFETAEFDDRLCKLILQISIKDIPSVDLMFRQTEIAPAEQTQTPSVMTVVAESAIESRPIATPSPDSSTGPFASLLRERAFVTAREASGAPASWNYYRPAQLASICRWLMARLMRRDTRDLAGASLLSMLTHQAPRKLGKLPVFTEFTPSEPLHIEIGRGLLWIEIAAVIDQPGVEKDIPSDNHCNWSRWSAIPLPAPLHDWLLKLAQGKKFNKFGELMECDTKSFRQTLTKFMNGCEVNSRGTFMSFVRGSYSRTILSLCRDEVYAGLIGLDFTMVSTANFNYARLDPVVIWRICMSGYQHLGLGNPVARPTLKSAGSRFLLSDNLVEELLAGQLKQAFQAIATLPHKCPKQTLHQVHRELTQAVLTLLVLTTGHRSAAEYSYTPAGIDLELGAALIGDKVSAQYHWLRVVPLTPLVIRWLQVYFQWLQVLAYRYQKIDLRISQQLARLRPDADQLVTDPLFQHFSLNGELCPSGTALIWPIFAQLKTSRAPGRHWIDRVLRLAGLDGSSIGGFMGRGLEGQEQFGKHSVDIVVNWLDRVRGPIQQKLESFLLPEPPTLSGRQISFARIGSSHGIHTPRGLHKRKRKSHQGLSSKFKELQGCPFNPATLWLSSCFCTLARGFQRQPPIDAGLRLVLRLVFESGIAAADELQAAFTEILGGKVHWASERPMVDFHTVRTGLRRRYLSSATLRDAQKIRMHSEPASWTRAIEMLPAHLDRLVQWRTWSSDPVHFLCQSAAAFHCLVCPAVLVWWGRGEMWSRLAEPQLTERLGHAPTFMTLSCEAIDQHGTRQGKSLEQEEITKVRRAIRPELAIEQKNLGKKAMRTLLLERLTLCQPGLRTMAGKLASKLVVHALQAGCQGDTALNYLSSISGEIEIVSRHWEQSTSLEDLDQEQFITTLINQASSRTDEERSSRDWATALNHLSRALGAQRRVRSAGEKGLPPSTYSPTLSPAFSAAGLEWISQQVHVKKFDRMYTRAKFSLFASTGARGKEVDCMRLCDLNLDSMPDEHELVIHPAAGGRKTANAKRVIIPQFGNQFLEPVRTLLAQRSRETPNDELAFLFGDPTQHRTLSSDVVAKSLMANAIKALTGDPGADVRVFRHMLITQRFTELLDPERYHFDDGLSARQALYFVAYENGHGDINMSAQAYTHDVEIHHQAWHAKALGLKALELSPPNQIGKKRADQPEPAVAVNRGDKQYETPTPPLLTIARFMSNLANGKRAEDAARLSALEDHWVDAVEKIRIEVGIGMNRAGNLKPAATALNHWLDKVCPYVQLLPNTTMMRFHALRCLCSTRDAWPVHDWSALENFVLPLASLIAEAGLSAILTIDQRLFDDSWSRKLTDSGASDLLMIRIRAERKRGNGLAAHVMFAPAAHMKTSITRSGPIATNALASAVGAFIIKEFLKEISNGH